jgi:hypothetical protein
MPEREQQPFDEFLKTGPVKPFFVIERLTVADSLFDMLTQLVDYHFFTTDEDNLVHIAE